MRVFPVSGPPGRRKVTASAVRAFDLAAST
jgi:hypothetical protein